jgi:chromosome condensin MukBEF MukE localization factor
MQKIMQKPFEYRGWKVRRAWGKYHAVRPDGTMGMAASLEELLKLVDEAEGLRSCRPAEAHKGVDMDKDMLEEARRYLQGAWTEERDWGGTVQLQRAQVCALVSIAESLYRIAHPMRSTAQSAYEHMREGKT